MYETLPPIEQWPPSVRYFYAFYDLTFQCGSGGFAQAAYNAPELFPIAREAYEFFGHQEAVAICDKAIALLPEELVAYLEKGLGDPESLQDVFDHFDDSAMADLDDDVPASSAPLRFLTTLSLNSSRSARRDQPGLYNPRQPELVALGPAYETRSQPMRAVCLFVAICMFERSTNAEVTIVRGGKATAVVVTADDPTGVARYAARELVQHVRKATGQQLKIVKESKIPTGFASRIFVGVTKAAGKQGIDAAKMKPDEYVLRTANGDLYIVGKEDRKRTSVLGDPANHDWTKKILHDGIYGYRGPSSISPNGTLFGVYEVLERFVGVRWLWPGDLGTYVPQRADIVIKSPLDKTHVPCVPWRRFAWFHLKNQARSYQPKMKRLAFTRQGLRKFWRATGVYLGRHRMGHSTHPPAFREEFAYPPWVGGKSPLSKKHPKFYAMDSGGRRIGQSGYVYNRPDMCVSNPALHTYIIDKVWRGSGTLKIGQVNTKQFCHCQRCMSWDGPQPKAADIPSFERGAYGPRSVSHRYAKFWKTITAKASKRRRNFRATVLMYETTLPEPASIKLPSNIFGQYCPWTGAATNFPMRKNVDDWSRNQWLGWKKTGMSMTWRPNHLHMGYTMPYLSTRQVGEFFKFTFKNGSKGYFFDSLRVSWATQGPMIYIHMALGWNPDADVEQLRKDYWSAFGPAAVQVEKYFDYWEAYSLTHPQGSLYNPIRANEVYPPSVFAKQSAVLAEALKLAAGNKRAEYANRVKFLQAGLEHARLCAKFMGTLNKGKVPLNAAGLARSKAALEEMVKFRRANEHLFIADYIDAAFRENNFVKGIDKLFAADKP